MKKISKILLTLFLVIITGQVYADTITVDNTKQGVVDTGSYLVTNTGTLTVTGVDRGDTFQAYKLADIYYNENTNTFSIQLIDWVDEYCAFDDDPDDDVHLDTCNNNILIDSLLAIESGNISNGSVTSDSGLDRGLSSFTAYIKENNITGIDMTVNGTTATGSNLGAGMYLVLPKTTKRVYAVMAGNIEFRENNGEWKLYGDTIVAKVSDAGINSYLYENLSTEGTYSFDDTVTYVYEATVPIYPTNATNKVIRITCNYDLGFTYELQNTHLSMGDVYVNADTTSSTYVYEEGQIVGIRYNLYNTNVGRDSIVGSVIVKEGVTIMELDADELVDNSITFSAVGTLNSNATLGNSGNHATATLEYANDPYGEGTTTVSSEITAYTYGIRLFAKNSDDTGLNGVVYNVYSDSEYTDLVGTITTDGTGYGELAGIKEGTYYIKQSKAATGYKLNSEGFSLTIDNTLDYTEQEVLNEKASLLPATGGIGTYIFMGIGLILVIFAFIFLILNKRKKGDNNEENK